MSVMTSVPLLASLSILGCKDLLLVTRVAESALFAVVCIKGAAIRNVACYKLESEC